MSPCSEGIAGSTAIPDDGGIIAVPEVAHAVNMQSRARLLVMQAGMSPMPNNENKQNSSSMQVLCADRDLRGRTTGLIFNGSLESRRRHWIIQNRLPTESG